MLTDRIAQWCADNGRTIEVGKPNSIGYRNLAKILGASARQVRAALEEMRKGSAPATEEFHEQTRDGWNIVVNRTRICTLEQLLEHCKVNTDVWEVERFVVNKWEVGAKDAAKRIQAEPLYQVKAWLRKKCNVAFAAAEVDALRRKAEACAPTYPQIIFRDRKQSGNLLEVSIADHHFGRLCWARETGWADYDTRIAQRIYEQAFTVLLDRTRGFGIDEVLIPVGNDLQHTDNRQGTTTRGTPQDTDSRYQKVFETARDAVIWSIEAALTIAPRVTVIPVPGNHDFLSTWHLGDSLRSWFHRTKAVTVHNEPTFRKYYQHGNVMLMFTHGNTGKLEEYPLIMASEQRRMWGDTTWREAHTGDKHQRRLLELKGASVRILPSLCPPDAWTSENCYVGSVRAAEAYVWNANEGLIGTGVYSVPPDTPPPAKELAA